METVNCTENLDEFVLGKYIPDGEKIVFKESYVTKAVREGGAVVFEEINFAKPHILLFSIPCWMITDLYVLITGKP